MEYMELAAGETIPQTALEKALGSTGAQLKVYRGCRLALPERIYLGDFTQVDEGVRIFGGMGVRIGRHVHLAFDTAIYGGGECEIGDYAATSASVRIVTGSELVRGGGLTNPTIPAHLRSVERSKVVIGRFAILYTGVIVFPGVKIGEGAAVSAGGIVHHDLDPWCIYAGNPLVKVGMRDREQVLRKAALLEPGRRIAIVALGSNMGESATLLRDAMNELWQFSLSQFKESSVWESSPVDCPPGSPNFLNAVVSFRPRADLTPEQLLSGLQEIEKKFGRGQKKVTNEPRTLDLDLIAFGQEVRNRPEFTLPHPRAHQRGFVLRPLAEIEPDFLLPGQEQTVAELVATRNDPEMRKV
ncbi:MAG: 2-amino-4-hydroxy-6-hydroxymethyldihydropteridine diphosphokinase [Verrucomicrobiales bacterium]